ncbi:MAG TPA: NmrA family NAD(P)-binding protein [Kofleriaceae bacterium]|nr:NmrA family NAD(P)-binding protein [Kofleriaceae bacterium]
MTIAITTPTGNIGRRVTERLLQAGADVTLLVRDPAKVADFAARGAKVVATSLDDRAAVLRATEGASSLFWVTPPNVTSNDYLGWQRQLAEIARAAVEKNRIGRVVQLSSAGAQHESGTGPVAGLFHLEQALASTAAHVVFLRAGHFMENNLAQLDAIRGPGQIFSPVAGSVRTPMVATRDIGDVAATLLLDGNFEGKRVRGVHGPADLTFDEAAAAIGEGIGKRVTHVTVPAAAVKANLVAAGASENVVDLLLEMFAALASGHMDAAEARTAETTTPTTLTEFARDTIKPLL